MTRVGLAQIMCEKTGMSLKDSLRAVEVFFEAMSESLLKRDKIEIRGFGSFKTVKRAPKKVQDIGRGYELNMPSHLTVKFKVSGMIKDKLNGSEKR